jgi:hypothetical protein
MTLFGWGFEEQPMRTDEQRSNVRSRFMKKIRQIKVLGGL